MNQIISPSPTLEHPIRAQVVPSEHSVRVRHDAALMYRKDDLAGLRDLHRSVGDGFLSDAPLSFYLFSALAKANLIGELEALYPTLLSLNKNNSEIIYRVMAHQRSIRNTARFFELMMSYAKATYKNDQVWWQWRDLYERVVELGRLGGESGCSAEVVTAFRREDLTRVDPTSRLFDRLRCGEEFLFFYESARLLHGFAERFKRPAFWSFDDETYWDALVNREEAGSEVRRASAEGPNVFILLHSPFNKLILRFFQHYAVNARTIAKSLYKSQVDDGHMLFFQADKSSRLAVFYKAFKQLHANRGNVMLAPDGVTGGSPSRGMIFGAPLSLYGGAPHLAKSARARTYLLHPSFRADGIFLNVFNLECENFALPANDFDEIWRDKLCAALERIYEQRDSVMSIPPRFLASV